MLRFVMAIVLGFAGVQAARAQQVMYYYAPASAVTYSYPTSYPTYSYPTYMPVVQRYAPAPTVSYYQPAAQPACYRPTYTMSGYAPAGPASPYPAYYATTAPQFTAAPGQTMAPVVAAPVTAAPVTAAPFAAFGIGVNPDDALHADLQQQIENLRGDITTLRIKVNSLPKSTTARTVPSN